MIINVVLLSMLIVVACFIARSKDLMVTVILFSIYGLLCASFFMLMDAVDVAFTEAAVGAGISPLLMLITLASVGRFQQAGRYPVVLIGFIGAVLGGLLVWATLGMPMFGDALAPVHQHVAPRYIEESGVEVGVPNIVTSVLASYRAFDTLGEVVVIFTAGVGVLSLLGGGSYQKRFLIDRIIDREEHKILRVVSKILIPPILLFALYVQFHGDYGPGGGFQAGVIFAAGVVLYTLFFGLKVVQQVISEMSVRVLAALGVLLYGCVGLVSLLKGHNYLDYYALAANPKTGQHLGILVIELGVGITVASVMILFFYTFARNFGGRGAVS
nr:Na(+)/H(+) antiporter subunit B [Neptunicella marina]